MENKAGKTTRQSVAVNATKRMSAGYGMYFDKQATKQAEREEHFSQVNADLIAEAGGTEEDFKNAFKSPLERAYAGLATRGYKR